MSIIGGISFLAVLAYVALDCHLKYESFSYYCNYMRISKKKGYDKSVEQRFVKFAQQYRKGYVQFLRIAIPAFLFLLIAPLVILF